MAKSKFEYVKQFETEDKLLPNCWIVVRIDGKGFHRFSEVHNYIKPNDDRALDLMSKAAETVMEEFKDIVLGYGQSDEYSFVFKKNTNVYNRRASKLSTNVVSLFASLFVYFWPRYFGTQMMQYPPAFDSRMILDILQTKDKGFCKLSTNVVSLFASSFVYFWPRYFGTQMMQYPPAFDSRTVLYPTDKNLRDYLSWRQADCHINNLYNTCFWKLIQEKGLNPAEAQDRLKGTMSSDKNELLFKEFEINYNNLHALHRKGTILVRTPKEVPNGDLDLSLQLNLSGGGGPSFGSSTARSPTSARSIRSARKSTKPNITRLYTDLIGEQFWTEHPELLETVK